jgi:hypothetical protein
MQRRTSVQVFVEAHAAATIQHDSSEERQVHARTHVTVYNRHNSSLVRL